AIQFSAAPTARLQEPALQATLPGTLVAGRLRTRMPFSLRGNALERHTGTAPAAGVARYCMDTRPLNA
ncbi:MAG: hypothetical protein L0Y45_00745, partial [Woeseiaceae bacterium]|nr:hypothetical protein [Woeseiaceae bacterium]